MKSELALMKSEKFGEIECDFYGDGEDFWMTREQIGAALEYSNPRDAIAKIHRRKRARMDRFSGVVKLSTPGGEQEVTVYNRKGIMEICRHSDQPKADAFMDFCWEVMDSLMSGKAKIVCMTEYQQIMAQTRVENVRIRKAQILERLAAQYDGTYKQVLQAYATKELTGEFLLPLPKLERKTYSAAEIGAELNTASGLLISPPIPARKCSHSDIMTALFRLCGNCYKSFARDLRQCQHRPLAQRQSIRLLTGRLRVRAPDGLLE